MTKPHTTLSEAVRALPLQKRLADFNSLREFQFYCQGFAESRDAILTLVEQHEAQEPIGAAFGMPGTADGFTMCTFEGKNVPVGTLLYAQPTLAVTQAGDAWISIQDRLPEMHTEVMVWPHPSDYIMTAEVDRNGTWSYNEYCSNWGNENVKLAQGRITHWMPLPSAPTTTRSE